MAARRFGLFTKMLFAACAGGVAFGLIELALIVAEPWMSKGFFVFDEDLGFRARAGKPGDNRFGFNDRDVDLDPAPGVYRVLFVGDSFNWAGGRDFNYTAVVRRLLERRFPEGKVEIVNTGYPMTHTGEQLAMLKKFGLRYKPDLVILGFFVGNDFLDGNPKRKRIVVNDAFMDVNPDRVITIAGRPIVFQSRLWALTKQTLVVLRQRVGDRVEVEDRASAPQAVPDTCSLVADRQEDEADRPRVNSERHWKALDDLVPQEIMNPTFAESTYLDIEIARLDFVDRARVREGRYDRNIAYILGQLGAMAELLSDRGIGFQLMLFPDEFQVNDELLDKMLSRTGKARADFDLLRGQTLVSDFAAERGIPVLDLRPALRVAQRVRATYHPRDSHWNHFGNHVVAHVIFDWLEPGVTEALRLRAAPE